MTSDLALQQRVTRDSIERDARFIGRYTSTASGEARSKIAPISSLALYGYFCSFIWESYQKWNFVRTDIINVAFEEPLRTIIENSRNSLKFFDDSELNVAEILSNFRVTVMEAHRDHFLSDFNQNDLGAFRYAEKVICTTHSVAFSLGAPSRLFLDEADYMKSLTTDLGRYIALWGATITPSASFLDHVDNDLVELDGDCSSKSVYASIFNESGPEELNGFLLALQGIMNFSTTLLSLDQNEESFYTIFKMRFLTLYSTVRSIQALIGFRSPDVPISVQSQLFMRRILSLPLAKLIVHDEKVAGLRRSLMHYKPDDQFTSSLSMSEPIYGILNATFLDLRFDEAVSSIYKCADDTSSLFEEWASRSSLQHHS